MMDPSLLDDSKLLDQFISTFVKARIRQEDLFVVDEDSTMRAVTAVEHSVLRTHLEARLKGAGAVRPDNVQLIEKMLHAYGEASVFGPSEVEKSSAMADYYTHRAQLESRLRGEK
jgi:hypothetical protein